ncbi:MAG TPA: SRPBCC domain-containing protein [Rhizomicrobium sp.]|nr:SRPBCC domain-containing protein [Rhizomicrobium sp.]
MSDPVFSLNRTFDAPLALMWEVYTQEKHLKNWWGPKGFEWVKGSLDFRPGGHFHYCMRAPTGDEMWGRFEYREIEPLKRIVFTTGFSNPAGEIVRAPFAANFPLRILNDVRFADQGAKTTLAMTGTPFEAPESEREFFRAMFPSMQQGYAGTLDQLADYVKRAQ